ncbi:hypothetical protein [Actinacidiphila glaucinigra]
MNPITSPEDIPARPWLRADTHRWAMARPAVWARPWWPASALLISVIAAIGLAPVEPCTGAAPCGPEWLDAVGSIGFFAQVVWLVVLPEAALVAGPLLLLWMLDPSTWSGGPAEWAADTGVVVSLCWGWAAVVLRLRARRVQRGLASEASGGVTSAVPAPTVRVRRGAVRIVAGLAGLAAGTAAGVFAVLGDRADEAHMAVAERVDAKLLDNRADAQVVVRLADGTRRRVGVMFPEDYERGSTVTVLVDGDWVRLAAEPYGDRLGLQLLTLLGGAVGGGVLLSGGLTAARARALRGGPAPVLRVVAVRHGGFTGIFPADGGRGDPVLTFRTAGPAAQWPREGVLYGLPSEGAELVLRTTTPYGHLVAEATTSPARPRPLRRHPEHVRE